MPQGSPPPFAQNRSNMAIFKVEGGRRLRGEITPQGAKNEALQILCATLLTQEKVIVHNVPQILDVIQLIELLQAMGVEVERLSEESYSFRAADIDPDYLRSDDYCRRASRLRGSVMLLGPMLARFGVGYMPKPGGDLGTQGFHVYGGGCSRGNLVQSMYSIHQSCQSLFGGLQRFVAEVYRTAVVGLQGEEADGHWAVGLLQHGVCAFEELFQ